MINFTEEQRHSILTYNKLMAEYLGYKYFPYNYEWSEDNTNRDAGWKVHEKVPSLTKMRMHEKDFLCRNHNDLQFHSDWNWLHIVIAELFRRHRFIVYSIVDMGFVYHYDDFIIMNNKAFGEPKHFSYNAKTTPEMLIIATWECAAFCIAHIMTTMDPKIPILKDYKMRQPFNSGDIQLPGKE